MYILTKEETSGSHARVAMSQIHFTPLSSVYTYALSSKSYFAPGKLEGAEEEAGACKLGADEGCCCLSSDSTSGTEEEA
jgi:hypothetical protein